MESTDMKFQLFYPDLQKIRHFIQIYKSLKMDIIKEGKAPTQTLKTNKML